MGRYELFRELMAALGHCGAEITGANMRNFLGEIEVEGVTQGSVTIRITAEIKEADDA